MILRIAAGARRRRDHEHNGRAWLAYHVAALMKAKRPPNLRALMIDTDRTERQPQGWREQIAVLRQMAAAAQPRGPRGRARRRLAKP